MQAEITFLKSQVTELKKTQSANHKDNRKDIQDLRAELQKLIMTLPDAIRESMDKMGDKVARQISEAILPLQSRQERTEDKVYGLELKWAKASGYAAAGAVGAGFLFEAAKVGLEHLIGVR
jgi:ElaB/YqjD/DUF883 family membrane-anchored ribosome-binding protein